MLTRGGARYGPALAATAAPSVTAGRTWFAGTYPSPDRGLRFRVYRDAQCGLALLLAPKSQQCPAAVKYWDNTNASARNALAFEGDIFTTRKAAEEAIASSAACEVIEMAKNKFFAPKRVGAQLAAAETGGGSAKFDLATIGADVPRLRLKARCLPPWGQPVTFRYGGCAARGLTGSATAPTRRARATKAYNKRGRQKGYVPKKQRRKKQMEERRGKNGQFGRA